MKDLIRQILRESVGVPTGIHEISTEIFEEILNIVDRMEESGSQEFEEMVDISHKDMMINDMPVNELFITFQFIETEQVDEVKFVGMSISSTSKIQDKKIIYGPNKGTLKIKIVIAIPENTDISNIQNFFEDEKTEIVSSLSHELMHAYDMYKSKFGSVKKSAEYHAYKDLNFDIPPINHFTYYLYFTHQIENVVRPSEIYSLAKSKNITEKEFYEFLTNTRVFNSLKNARDFSYEKLRKDLKDYLPKIDEIFNIVGIDKDMSDEEKIDEFLRIIYVTIVNKNIESLKNYLSGSFIAQLLGLVDEEEDEFFYELAEKATRFENNEKNFYLYEIKKMNQVANNIIKKISKVYSLMKQETKESIVDWDLYKKLFVKETKLSTDYNFKRRK